MKSLDNILYKCIDCKRYRVIKNGVDGNTCNRCGGYLELIRTTNLPTSKEDNQMDEPLLTIELQDETSVPKVLYKGKEIPNKVNVSFDWETDTDYWGGLSYAIEHYEKENYPVANRIERRVKGHAVD